MSTTNPVKMFPSQSTASELPASLIRDFASIQTDTTFGSWHKHTIPGATQGLILITPLMGNLSKE
jgi:hypothetical protein